MMMMAIMMMTGDDGDNFDHPLGLYDFGAVGHPLYQCAMQSSLKVWWNSRNSRPSKAEQKNSADTK